MTDFVVTGAGMGFSHGNLWRHREDCLAVGLTIVRLRCHVCIDGYCI